MLLSLQLYKMLHLAGLSFLMGGTLTSLLMGLRKAPGLVCQLAIMALIVIKPF